MTIEAAQATPAVRLGIIGCGRVLSGPYRPVLRGLLEGGTVEVTVACDLRVEREAFVREAFGAKRFTTDYHVLLDADDVDLVLILTTPAAHAQLAMEGLAAGKHVLVEKPLALTLEDGMGVLEAARRNPGRLVCAPFVTLSPTYQSIVQAVRTGQIGRVLTARTISGWAGPDWGAWFYQGLGGGPLFDLGVYNLTTLTGLMGPVRRITAMSGIAIPQRSVGGAVITADVDDNFQVLLDFGNAVFGVLTTGFTIQQLRTPAIELYGSTGTIQMLGADWHPAGYEIWQNDIGAWTLIPESAPGWSYADGLRHQVASIHQGVAPSLTPEHAVHVLEVMLLALEAGRDGRTRDLTTTFEMSQPTEVAIS